MGLRSLFIFTLLIAAEGAGAQQAVPGKDTVLKGSTIEVLQSYKPQVKQVPKPQWVPQLPPGDTTHPAMSYEVPQQTLYYTYSSLPLRPLALGKDTNAKPFANYLKIGAGNISTLFLDAGIGGIQGKDYETAIHLHHLSQKGSILYQQSSLSGVEADAWLHKSKGDWHTGINVERNQYYYYGYDHTLPFNQDSLKQTYTTIRAMADFKNKDTANWLSYHPALSASLYNAKFNTSEITVAFNVPLTVKIDSSIDAVIGINGVITSYNTDSGSVGNNFIQALPGVNFHGKGLSGHALIGFAFGKGGSFYVLPDVIAEHTFAGAGLTFGAGWQSALRQNTYEQLTTENPYLTSMYAVAQSRRDEAFVSMRGSTGNHLSFTARASWWNFRNLATYLSDYGDAKQFYVSYQDMHAVSLHAGARYQVASLWAVGLSGDLYKFSGSTATPTYAWGIPNTRIKADFIFMPASKFTFTAYLAMQDGMYAKDLAGGIQKLSIISDIGLNAEYSFISRLSVFAQVDNILNQKYERWYGYQSYGINVYGGLRLKF